MSLKHKVKLFAQQRDLIDERIAAYAEEHTSPPSEILRDVEATTKRLGLRSIMLADRAVARLLKVLAATLRPQLALEVGTFTGYSALSIAEGLPPGGRVVTCEKDVEIAETARAFFLRSPYADRIDLRVGPAIPTIRALDKPIDLAFIDGEKTEYWDYYDTIVDRLAPAGVIVIDNTLLLGSVLLSDDEISGVSEPVRLSCQAIKRFNKRLREDPRSETCFLTVSDGITLVTRSGRR